MKTIRSLYCVISCVCLVGIMSLTTLGCQEPTPHYFSDLDGTSPITEEQKETEEWYYQFTYNAQDEVVSKSLYYQGVLTWKKYIGALDGKPVLIHDYFEPSNALIKRCIFYKQTDTPNYLKIEYYYPNGKLRRIWSFSRTGEMDSENYSIEYQPEQPEPEEIKDKYKTNPTHVNYTTPNPKPAKKTVASPMYDQVRIENEPAPVTDVKEEAELANSIFEEEDTPIKTDNQTIQDNTENPNSNQEHQNPNISNNPVLIDDTQHPSDSTSPSNRRNLPSNDSDDESTDHASNPDTRNSDTSAPRSDASNPDSNTSQNSDNHNSESDNRTESNTNRVQEQSSPSNPTHKEQDTNKDTQTNPSENPTQSTNQNSNASADNTDTSTQQRSPNANNSSAADSKSTIKEPIDNLRPSEDQPPSTDNNVS